ncbi:MAG: class I SAM-dependent methyltransferase [Chloroflexaceae bacterium]|nr:class I SAM-dependent methyltransferase [Chloroflexaceae bacterium]
MYPDVLPYLRCPRRPALTLELEPGAQYARDGAIVRGSLRVEDGSRHYAIKDGILDLLGPFELPDSPAQVTNYLPLTAWGYERLWRWRALTLLMGEPFGYDQELPLITGLMQPGRGGLYLDVACSNGLYARTLAQHIGPQHGPVVGFDHSVPMLQQARTYAQRAGLRISYIRAKAQALPIAAGSAAGVCMGGSLNEIGDRMGFLHETRRVLDTRGRLVMMHLTRADQLPGNLLQSFLSTGGIAFPTLDRTNQEVAEAGLHRAAQWRYGVVAFSLWLAAPVGAAPAA